MSTLRRLPISAGLTVLAAIFAAGLIGNAAARAVPDDDDPAKRTDEGRGDDDGFEDDGTRPEGFEELPEASEPHSPQDQALADQVSKVRGRPWRKAVPFREIDDDEVRRILELSFTDKFGDGVAAEKAYRALGLIGPAQALRDSVVSQKAAQVKGFYLAKALGPYGRGRVYVRRGIGRERAGMLAHELVHALDDQHFGLHKRMTKEIPTTVSGELHADRFRSFMATEEGIAQIVWRAIMAEGSEADFGIDLFDGKIGWPEAQALFPQVAGWKFIRESRRKGGAGWTRANALYRNPPLSSEQILHPERFFEDKDSPLDVILPDLVDPKSTPLQGEWELLRSNTLGELGVSWLLGTGAGVGWDGDSYAVIESTWDHQVLACWMTAWDEPSDASEFATAMVELLPQGEWLKDGHAIFVEQRDREVLVLAGVQRLQIDPLRKILWKKTNFKKTGGDSAKGREDDGEHRERVAAVVELFRAKKGMAIAERSEKSVEIFRSLQLDDVGRKQAKDLMKTLKDRERAEEAVTADGRRFVEAREEGWLASWEYRSSTLRMGMTRSEERRVELAELIDGLAR